MGTLSQDIWECLWRSRCEWTGWQKMVAEFVFQAAAAVMIWSQTAKRLVISVRHSYRYPIEVIGHAVWLYHRFGVS